MVNIQLMVFNLFNPFLLPYKDKGHWEFVFQKHLVPENKTRAGSMVNIKVHA